MSNLPRTPDYDWREPRTLDFLLRRAEESGCELLIPDDREIQIDYDGPRDEEQFSEVFAVIQRVFSYVVVKDDYPSRNGGRHVILRIESSEVSELERILLAALLGNDPIRAALSWYRIKIGVPYPAVLFKPKAS